MYSARNLLAPTENKERPTDTRRSVIPRFDEEHFELNRQLGLRIEELAQSKGVTAAQLSMGWLLQKSHDLGISTLPIPGTKTLSHALDNIASAKVSLSPSDMTLLEEVALMASGNRESDSYMERAIEGNTQRAAKL